MGLLIDGRWSTNWYDTSKSGGHFVRETARHRNWITVDGASGPTGEGGFAAESGRYHLYVSYACPWAHRTLIFRLLKDLTDHVSVSVVHPLMLENGWSFEKDDHGAVGDELFGCEYLHQIYTRSSPGASGRVTVPVLWDRKQDCIVSNESSEIIRMFNSAFDRITGNRDDYWPEELRDEIEEVNVDIYENINNGVYRTGFATTVRAYEESVTRLFDALDRMEARLSAQRYLTGDRITEADWRFFPTLVRFVRSMSAISNATSAVLRIIRRCQATCVNSTRCRHRRDGCHEPHQATLLWQSPDTEPHRDCAGRPAAGLRPARSRRALVLGPASAAPRRGAEMRLPRPCASRICFCRSAKR